MGIDRDKFDYEGLTTTDEEDGEGNIHVEVHKISDDDTDLSQPLKEFKRLRRIYEC